MTGKNVTAQELTIKLLRSLELPNRNAVYHAARKRLAADTAAIEQLGLCVMMASELARNPKKYQDSFLSLARTIIARQKKTAVREIRMRDMGTALGGTKKDGTPLAESGVNAVLYRIEKHTRELKPEEIARLCAGFERESDRLFWKNQVYLIFPELRTPDVTDGPVLNCLQAVWDSMPQEQREDAPFVFLPYRDWFVKLQRVQEEEVLQAPNGLYDLLERERRRAGLSKTEMAYILPIDPDTYASYKRAWIKFENNNCKGDFPRNRLSREELLYLAVYLKMDFYTAVAVLAAAGYSFRLTSSDRVVAGYLFDRRCSQEEALNALNLV